MLSAGDVQGCLRKLEALLRAIKYAGNVDYNGLSKGDPSAFLPIVSFTLTSFSPPFSEQLIATGHELTGKTDLRFTDTLYKVLRDIFHYKPILTKQQFLQWGFSQRKISVLCDIINLVLQKHNQLKKPRVRCPASNRDGRGDAHRMVTEAETVSDRPFVVNHTENPHTFAINLPNVEAVYSHSPGNGSRDLEGGKENKDHFLHSSKVEERLSALEAQLESLSGLHKINVLEKRLEELERQRNTDMVDESEGQLITISKENWDNLTSRVLLLETKMELSNTQSSAPPPCPSCTSSCSSHSISDASKEDLKDRLERITNMLKSTSVLLKNTESPTTPCK